MSEIKKLVLIALVYIFIYFIFSADLIYRPAVSYFPFYYPMCIFFGIILLLVTNTFFVHAKRKDFMIAMLITLVLIYAVPFIFNILLGSHLKRYYRLLYSENLLDFPRYLLDEFFGK